MEEQLAMLERLRLSMLNSIDAMEDNLMPVQFATYLKPILIYFNAIEEEYEKLSSTLSRMVEKEKKEAEQKNKSSIILLN